ncbi:MAG: tRNA guanosine(34) transglycosylase Tgt [Deltaproteobacteria bacterium]|nr:tRNA guanosine(34) transglycosylase Tgt [Deltaproteobacteria bacterium]
MPVGTQATVKAQTVESLKATGAQLLLANTYHLLLRPGPLVFKKFGGIHRFMNWDGPVLTDSGGFQIFSLPHSRAMDEAGARFKSYVDGKTYLLSPESSIEMQQTIGSDIMMVLDQCIHSTAPYPEAQAAMDLTHRWAQRALNARGDSRAALFGIVQGGGHHELRKASAEILRALPFDGLAIGGLAVGETHAERYDLTERVTEHLPTHRPRYLMGVGTPIDILEAVHRGVDMFDCTIPTQLAQRGVAFTSHGKLQLRRTVHKFTEESVDAGCDCQSCRHYSRAYIHHLIKSDELLGWHLLGMHNLAFYHRLMRQMRERILAGDFAAYYRQKRRELMRSDEDNPARPPKKAKVTHPARLGDYELHRSVQGFYSLRQISSGEIMHSVTAPSEEANKLYVEQPALASRLINKRSHCAAGVLTPALIKYRKGEVQPPLETPFNGSTLTSAWSTTNRDNVDELVIWDVGLGAAANAMAAIHCFEKRYKDNGRDDLRPVRLLSFERDLDPLILAASHPDCLPHMRHGAPSKILAHGGWRHASGLLHWQLLKGDFRDYIDSAHVPDIIFYDPFSYKTDAELWTGEIFARIFTRCAAKPAEIYTYSASTAVRVALLSAGFFVAQGVGIGPKSETTIAFNRAESAGQHPLAPRLLDQKWLARWRRSAAKFPATISQDEKARFATLIENHRQFLTTV